MTGLDRRSLLGLGLGLGCVAATGGLISGARAETHGDSVAIPAPSSSLSLIAAPPVVSPFTVRMPVPPLLTPQPGTLGVDHYRIPIQPTQVEVFPGLWTPMLTYGRHFVGPTVRAKAGRPVVVSFGNQLSEPANVHLHGAYVPAEHDGHPMDLIGPGLEHSYEYPNAQRGATLWYHDHSHHAEAEHLYRGLHGFYLIDDPDESGLGLPSGPCDVPILLRDALFGPDAGLIFNPMEPAKRTTILANGKPQPYFPVAQTTYRFRILNASNQRILKLNLGGHVLNLIATDGGLLPAPVPLTELTLTPAERAEVIIDFSKYALGDHVVLFDATGPVLRFDISQASAQPGGIPQTLRPLPDFGRPTTHRDFTFGFNPHAMAFEINGRPFDSGRVEAVVGKGTVETWRITNLDRYRALSIDHNFHPHAAQFRILDRDGKAPDDSEAGIKDTAWIPPGTSLRIQIRFGQSAGRYVFHCHMLEHAALGMMAQFEVAP